SEAESPSPLRFLRGDRTLKQAAEDLGYSAGHLSKVERGLCPPSAELLARARARYGAVDLGITGRGRPRGRSQLASTTRKICGLFGVRPRIRWTQPLRQEYALAQYHPVGRERLEALNSLKGRPPIFWKAVKTLPRRMNSP